MQISASLIISLLTLRYKTICDFYRIYKNGNEMIIEGTPIAYQYHISRRAWEDFDFAARILKTTPWALEYAVKCANKYKKRTGKHLSPKTSERLLEYMMYTHPDQLLIGL